MRNQIDQSNIVWRREINTANTVNENRANQTNAAIMLGLTQQAQNQLWQKYRDEAHQLYTSLENETQRNHQIVLSAMENQFNTDMFDRTVEFKKQVQAGAASQSLLTSAIGIGSSILTREVDIGGGQKQSIAGAGIAGLFNFLGFGDDDDTSSGQFITDLANSGEFDLLDGDSFSFEDEFFE